LDAAREAARRLARRGVIDVTQRGQAVDPEADWRGPIRLRLRRQGAAAAEGTAAAVAAAALGNG
jgi:hypothetical protein